MDINAMHQCRCGHSVTFDATRVVLGGGGNSDYINASWVTIGRTEVSTRPRLFDPVTGYA